MAAGDLTVTIVGRYATMELAVAALTAGNDAAATDHHDLYIETGVGADRYVVVKYVRAAA